MIQGCEVLENFYRNSPALKEQRIDAIASPLPLVATEIVSSRFFYKETPNRNLARTRPFRARKKLDYEVSLLQGGEILLTPASDQVPQKPIYLGKVLGLEHYPETNTLRVRWEFSEKGEVFSFLERKIDGFLRKILKEIQLLPFARYIVEQPVYTIKAEALSRRQKQRLIKWAANQAQYLPVPRQKQILKWVRQKNYDELLLYKRGYSKLLKKKLSTIASIPFSSNTLSA